MLHGALLVRVLAEWDGDRDPPEHGCRRVGRQLTHLPVTGEHREHPSCSLNADSTTPVLAQDEELRHVVRLAGPDEREACDAAAGPNQERMPIRFRPVLVEIGVSEEAVLIDVLRSELREVVDVELEEVTHHGFVFECGRHHLDIECHQRIMPFPELLGDVVGVCDRTTTQKFWAGAERGRVGHDEGMELVPQTQYATDDNLRARQRLWERSTRRPAFSLYPWVIALAELRGGERVLDVGCGNGSYLALVEAIGLDMSTGMLATARERAIGPLVCGDVQHLPFPADSFDVALAPHMLYHVDDRRAAARELRRVVEPGGRCIAVTNGAGNHAELVRLVEEVVGHGWRWRRPSDAVFSLENGARQLSTAFAHVDRVDCPPGVVLVEDADALAAYLASVGDHYESEVLEWTTWAEVVAECRRRAAEVIQEQGAFVISSSVGAFVCH